MPAPSPTPLPLPRAALLFRLLSDPTRLRFLLALDDGCEMSVGQLAAASGRAVSAVSSCLRPLRVLGMVAGRGDGRRRLYRLASGEVRYLLGLECGGRVGQGPAPDVRVPAPVFAAPGYPGGPESTAPGAAVNQPAPGGV